MLSRNEAFQFAMNGPFLSCVLPDCSRRPSPSVGVLEDAEKDGRSLHAPILIGLSGILHI